MGTRLSFHGANLPDWDPDSLGQMLRWFRAKAPDKLAGLNAAASASIITDGKNADRHRRGWDQVAARFYGSMLEAIDRNFTAFTPVGGGRTIRCPAWAMGYDWRHPNGHHASTLARTIDRVCEAEGAEQVILLTHSMGGLVARYAMAINGQVTQRVAGVIHTMQPAVGAVVAARRFRTGFSRKIDGTIGEAMAEMVKQSYAGEGADGTYDEGATAKKFAMTWLFQAIFSDSLMTPNPEFYARLMAVVGGPNELLPSERGGRDWWPHAQRYPTIPLHDLYAANWDQQGLIPNSLKGDPVERALRDRFAEASHFHATIEDRYHPVTGVLHASGLVTDTMLDPERRPKEGDGTVPAYSARCPDLQLPVFAQAFDRVEHAACFEHRAFREAVLDGIALIAGGGPMLGNAPPPRHRAAHRP